MVSQPQEVGQGGGDTLDGGKNQNPKNSLWLPSKPPKDPWIKNKPPKKSHVKFLSLKISRKQNKFGRFYSQNYTAGIRKNYHESSDCVECPKNPY